MKNVMIGNVNTDGVLKSESNKKNPLNNVAKNIRNFMSIVIGVCVAVILSAFIKFLFISLIVGLSTWGIYIFKKITNINITSKKHN